MIKFQTDAWEWDLSNLGLTFNETSDYFSDKISKSFSFPVNVYLVEDVAVKLGLPNHNNIKSYQKKIYGYLIIDTKFYDAYLFINNLKGNRAEITFFYGKETLEVFDKKLSDLPFAATYATGGLTVFAKAQLAKEWPEATHNFPKIFRDEIQGRSYYEAFQFFMNNYTQNLGTWNFVTNSIVTIEDVETPQNRNVMVPCTYLLEILRVMFKYEGLQIKGEFTQHPLVKKLLYVPKNFFEKFAVTQFEDYSFGFFTSQETLNGNTINVYQKTHTPATIGTYSLKFKLNLSNAQARYFSLTVVQNGVTLYQASSTNKQVVINENLEINVIDDLAFFDIVVTLKLNEQDNSIEPYNSFSYEFKEGRLNVFPYAYNIANFMPNMKCRDFVNKIKTWFNLKLDYTANAVYITFLDNQLENIIFKNKTHLEEPEPTRTTYENNLFKLSYPDGQEVFYSADGQIFTTTDFVESETTPIDMDVLPLEVRENYGNVTAVYPEDEGDLMFCIFNGPVDGNNVAVDNIENQTLTLQDITQTFWKKWLKFRANSETYKDSFTMHISEQLDTKTGIFKYNKNHLIKSIRTKRIDEENWRVDVESETL